MSNSKEQPMETTASHTDCRTKDGITVGLIDSVITIARVLSKRGDLHNHKNKAVQEAMKDLTSDEDVSWLLTGRSTEMRLLDQKMYDSVVEAGKLLASKKEAKL